MTGFIDAHGNSRFQNNSKPDHYINNRAGFYYEKDEQTQYLFTASGVQINLVDLEKILLKAARLGAEHGGQIVFDKLAVHNKEEACKRLGMSLPTLNKRIAERKIRPVDGKITGASRTPARVFASVTRATLPLISSQFRFLISPAHISGKRLSNAAILIFSARCDFF